MSLSSYRVDESFYKNYIVSDLYPEERRLPAKNEMVPGGVQFSYQFWLAWWILTPILHWLSLSYGPDMSIFVGYYKMFIFVHTHLHKLVCVLALLIGNFKKHFLFLFYFFNSNVITIKPFSMLCDVIHKTNLYTFLSQRCAC